jgi:hypothetical protein
VGARGGDDLGFEVGVFGGARFTERFGVLVRATMQRMLHFVAEILFTQVTAM